VGLINLTQNIVVTGAITPAEQPAQTTSYLSPRICSHRPDDRCRARLRQL
jgi:hypothetical protein